MADPSSSSSPPPRDAPRKGEKSRPYYLTTLEKKWSRRYDFLFSQGYQLRPRCHPKWVPEWVHESDITKIRGYEDAIGMMPEDLLDATRLSDGAIVMIKVVEDTSPEVEIGQFFSSERLLSDPANHCAPVFDVLPDPLDPAESTPKKPRHSLLIMPLFRAFDDPPFENVQQVVDFVEQMLEGLDFMHRHNVAHRDGVGLNIMMDPSPLFPKGYHPRRPMRDRTNIRESPESVPRSQTTVKYYFIDFGLSVKFNDQESRHTVTGVFGRETTTPELSETVPYDPFPVDIYIAGMR